MKVALRHVLRWFCHTFHVRGRHRLADVIGHWLAPNKPEPVVINGVPILLDHSIGTCRLMYYGMYEENNLSFLCTVIRPGDIVIEPGANIGYMTAHLAGMVGQKGKVYALEPSLNCLEQLRQSIDQADLPQITLLPMALADQPAMLTFNDTPRAISRGYATLDVVNRPVDSKAVEVEATSVDALCEADGIGHVRFLKLDIEGAELLALKGSTLMLGKKGIDYILLETTMAPNTRSLNIEIIQLLTSYGYSSYLVTKSRKLTRVTLDVDSSMRSDVIWTHISQ